MPQSAYTAKFAYTWPTFERYGGFWPANAPALTRLIKVKVPDVYWVEHLQNYSDGNLIFVSVNGRSLLDNVAKAWVDARLPDLKGFTGGVNSKAEQPRMCRVFFEDGAVINFPCGEKLHVDLTVGNTIGPLSSRKKIKSIHMDAERRPL